MTLSKTNLTLTDICPNNRAHRSQRKFWKRITLEYYIGIGNSYRTRTYTTYSFGSPYFPQEMGNAYGVGKTINQKQSFPTFQLGIKIGFALNKKY